MVNECFTNALSIVVGTYMQNGVNSPHLSFRLQISHRHIIGIAHISVDRNRRTPVYSVRYGFEVIHVAPTKLPADMVV